jgi:phytanoyl-CoA hydroxylase
MTTGLAATSSSVARDVVHLYRENGYVHIPQVLSPEEVAVYREAARKAYETRTAYNGEDDKTFKQILQLWQTDETLRQLTFHAGLATIATQLAGVPLRLWHDQLLIKAPHNGAATEYHQDGPYWPHAPGRATSCRRGSPWWTSPSREGACHSFPAPTEEPTSAPWTYTIAPTSSKPHQR